MFSLKASANPNLVRVSKRGSPFPWLLETTFPACTPARRQWRHEDSLRTAAVLLLHSLSPGLEQNLPDPRTENQETPRTAPPEPNQPKGSKLCRLGRPPGGGGAQRQDLGPAGLRAQGPSRGGKRNTASSQPSQGAPVLSAGPAGPRT